MAAPLAKRTQVKPGHLVAVDDAWSAPRFKAVADAGRRRERGRT